MMSRNLESICSLVVNYFDPILLSINNDENEKNSIMYVRILNHEVWKIFLVNLRQKSYIRKREYRSINSN